MLRYVLPVLWMTFAHNGPYGGMSTPLQRVTSLRRRTQDNVPSASYWLRCVRARAGAEIRRVVGARGSGGGACNAPLPC